MIKALLESVPTCTLIELEEVLLKIELEILMKISDQKYEKLKLNFDLEEITSISVVSQYFMAGCIKSLVEKASPVNKIVLTTPAFQVNDDVLKNYKDLSLMIGGKHEKGPETQMISKKLTKKKGFKRHNSKVLPRPIIEEKKFEFDDVSSQEIGSEETITQILPSTSSTAAAATEFTDELIVTPPKKKSKKNNVKF